MWIQRHETLQLFAVFHRQLRSLVVEMGQPSIRQANDVGLWGYTLDG